jgi:hypothetical protein
VGLVSYGTPLLERRVRASTIRVSYSDIGVENVCPD